MMDKKLAEWFSSHDTGMSSKAIATWLSARVPGGRPPSDSADFGRCYRLLLHMGWRERIGEMANAGKLWEYIAGKWDIIEAAYLEDVAGGTGDKCSAVMGPIWADAYEHAGYTVVRQEDGSVHSAMKDLSGVVSMGNGMRMSFGDAL
jgi:hypothetical protein